MEARIYPSENAEVRKQAGCATDRAIRNAERREKSGLILQKTRKSASRLVAPPGGQSAALNAERKARTHPSENTEVSKQAGCATDRAIRNTERREKSGLILQKTQKSASRLVVPPGGQSAALNAEKNQDSSFKKHRSQQAGWLCPRAGNPQR
ncbi:hypothetical protein [Erwinia sp. S38]|uniref:hypothetical protein n=1 Tax=Erwinia sp. S38 TaxID=2769338 RepID=UPI00190CB798|nr:hypothetical protein [Erwinia sp. S38]MBK0001514.1 hypothetical protein [Erwinia sp. S38]